MATISQYTQGTAPTANVDVVLFTAPFDCIIGVDGSIYSASLVKRYGNTEGGYGLAGSSTLGGSNSPANVSFKVSCIIMKAGDKLVISRGTYQPYQGSTTLHITGVSA